MEVGANYTSLVTHFSVVSTRRRLKKPHEIKVETPNNIRRRFAKTDIGKTHYLREANSLSVSYFRIYTDKQEMHKSHQNNELFMTY